MLLVSSFSIQLLSSKLGCYCQVTFSCAHCWSAMMFHQRCWAAMLINAAGQQLFYSAAVQQHWIGLLLSSNLFLRPLLISNDVPPTLLGSNVDKCCWSASSFSIQLLSSSIEFGCYCQVTCPCAHCWSAMMFHQCWAAMVSSLSIQLLSSSMGLLLSVHCWSQASKPGLLCRRPLRRRKNLGCEDQTLLTWQKLDCWQTMKTADQQFDYFWFAGQPFWIVMCDWGLDCSRGALLILGTQKHEMFHPVTWNNDFAFNSDSWNFKRKHEANQTWEIKKTYERDTWNAKAKNVFKNLERTHEAQKW